MSFAGEECLPTPHSPLPFHIPNGLNLMNLWIALHEFEQYLMVLGKRRGKKKKKLEGFGRFLKCNALSQHRSDSTQLK